MGSNLLKFRMVSLEPSNKTLLEHKQKIQTKYYDCHTCNLPVLGEGNVVRMCLQWLNVGERHHKLSTEWVFIWSPDLKWNLLTKQISPTKIIRTSRTHNKWSTTTNPLLILLVYHMMWQKHKELHHLFSCCERWHQCNWTKEMRIS